MKEKLMKTMNSEVKKVVRSAKDAQKKLQTILKDQDWMEEARRYAEQQGKEVKKLFAGDVEKVKKFLEKERSSLEKFQKDLPSEVKKLKGFMNSQKKDLEKLLKNLRRASKTGKLKTTKKRTTQKKSSSSRGTSKKSSESSANA
jgi:uncharacterized protein YceH (UPF0502 family)